MKGEGKSRDFRYIALDIHKYYSVVAGVNREGEEILSACWENYAYFEEHRLGNYVKYNTFHRKQQKHRKPELIRKAIFRSENFSYEAETDISGQPPPKNRERLLDRNPHVRTRQLL